MDTPTNLDDAISKFNSLTDIPDLKSFLKFIMECLKNVNGFCEWLGTTYKRNGLPMVIRNGKGFITDLSQIRSLYASISSSNEKLSLSPS